MYDDFAHHNVNQIVWILAEEGACYMRPFARRPPQFGQIPQDFGARLPRDIPDGWIQLVIWELKAKSRTSFGSHSRKQENHQYCWLFLIEGFFSKYGIVGGIRPLSGVGEAIIKVIKETCYVTLLIKIICLMLGAYQPLYMEFMHSASSAIKNIHIGNKYQTLLIYSHQASCLENWRQWRQAIARWRSLGEIWMDHCNQGDNIGWVQF